MATLGCSKCKKKFSSGFGKRYLLVLIEKHGKKRINEDHRNCPVRVRSCKKKKKQKEKSWSQKLELDIVFLWGFHIMMQLERYSLIQCRTFSW